MLAFASFWTLARDATADLSIPVWLTNQSDGVSDIFLDATGNAVTVKPGDVGAAKLLAALVADWVAFVRPTEPPTYMHQWTILQRMQLAVDGLLRKPPVWCTRTELQGVQAAVRVEMALASVWRAAYAGDSNEAKDGNLLYFLGISQLLGARFAADWAASLPHSRAPVWPAVEQLRVTLLALFALFYYYEQALRSHSVADTVMHVRRMNYCASMLHAREPGWFATARGVPTPEATGAVVKVAARLAGRYLPTGVTPLSELEMSALVEACLPAGHAKVDPWMAPSIARFVGCDDASVKSVR